jgi:hypothetical protein
VLSEREINFSYDYRMRCENCPSSNLLSAENYHSLSGTGVTTCSSCGHDFNFGPKVIDVRDPEDEALDASKVPQLFWYHTTTDPEWPRASWELPEKELRHLRQTAQWPEEEIERHRRFYENQALHVGTYEAAIESMLRRINEQGDRGSVFYLYRVRLRSDLRVAPNWRDENQEQAAKITRMDLAAQEWDGLRYLNAYESMGSISLALVRTAIESTQRILLPIPGQVGPPRDALMARIRSYRQRVQDILTAAADRPPSALDELRRRAAERHGTTLHTPLPPEVHGVLKEMEDYVSDQYLAGVSPVVRHDFLHAVGRPTAVADDEAYGEWHKEFRDMAVLLTRAGDVLKALDNQPLQEVATG